MKGLYYKIKAKTGMSIPEIRRTAMKTATTAAKKLIEEVLGPETKRPGEAWFEALRLVLPVFWGIVKRKLEIPSVEEVLAEVKRKYPDYAERIKKAYTLVTA